MRFEVQQTLTHPTMPVVVHRTVGSTYLPVSGDKIRIGRFVFTVDHREFDERAEFANHLVVVLEDDHRWYKVGTIEDRVITLKKDGWMGVG